MKEGSFGQYENIYQKTVDFYHATLPMLHDVSSHVENALKGTSDALPVLIFAAAFVLSTARGAKNYVPLSERLGWDLTDEELDKPSPVEIIYSRDFQGEQAEEARDAVLAHAATIFSLDRVVHEEEFENLQVVFPIQSED